MEKPAPNYSAREEFNAKLYLEEIYGRDITTRNDVDNYINLMLHKQFHDTFVKGKRNTLQSGIT